MLYKPTKTVLSKAEFLRYKQYPLYFNQPLRYETPQFTFSINLLHEIKYIIRSSLHRLNFNGLATDNTERSTTLHVSVKLFFLQFLVYAYI